MDKLLRDYDRSIKRLKELKEEYDNYTDVKLDGSKYLLELQIDILERYIDVLTQRKRIYGVSK